MRWIVFENARMVIKGEMLLKKNGISVKVIPAPSDISSSCGMVLVVEDDKQEVSVKLLDSNNIKYKIYER